METEYYHQLYQNPAKSPLKPKKAPVITRGAYSKVRVGSYGTKDLLLIGAANKDREGKKDREGRQRQRRQAKTEKAKRQRRQKNKLVYSEIFVSYNGRRAVTVQRTSWKYGRLAL